MKKVIVALLLIVGIGSVGFGQKRSVSSSKKIQKKLKHLSYPGSINTANLDTVLPDQYQSQLSAVQAAGLWRSAQNVDTYKQLLIDGINVIPGQHGRSGVLIYNRKLDTWMIDIWCDKKIARSKQSKRFFAPRSKKPSCDSGGFLMVY